jgi:hypothetical protein
MSLLRGNTRRKLLLVGGTISGLIVAAAAVAYFTGANGSGTGSATAGSSTQWAASVNSSSATFTPSGYAAIYPGAGVEAVPFTITNNGKGFQNLKTVSYAIKNDGGSPALAETSTGTVITGCQASWFTATANASNPTLPDDIAAAGTYAGNVDVALTDSGSNQDPCQTASPGVIVTASSS